MLCCLCSFYLQPNGNQIYILKVTGCLQVLAYLQITVYVWKHVDHFIGSLMLQTAWQRLMQFIKYQPMAFKGMKKN